MTKNMKNDTLESFKQLKVSIAAQAHELRKSVQQTIDSLEKQIAESREQLAVIDTVCSTSPNPNSNMSFREAMAKATDNGRHPLTREELLRALPAVGYGRAVNNTFLNQRLYQPGIKRINGRFSAVV